MRSFASPAKALSCVSAHAEQGLRDLALDLISLQTTILDVPKMKMKEKGEEAERGR